MHRIKVLAHFDGHRDIEVTVEAESLSDAHAEVVESLMDSFGCDEETLGEVEMHVLTVEEVKP
jgi:hypothetical protein